MPGMDGIKCLEELRKNPRFINVTIIMLSTSMPEEVSEVLKRSGADFAFKKPTNMNGYHSILANVFNEDGKN